MKNFVLYFLVFGLVMISCNKNSNNDFSMINKWQTTYLKIEMPSFQQLDSMVVFEDTFDNNPERIAQSQYFSDGSFEAWFVNREGKEQDKTMGTWTMKEDSLFVEFFYGGRNVNVGYKIIPTENGFKGVSKYDWDEDGEYDDLLTMKTKIIE